MTAVTECVVSQVCTRCSQMRTLRVPVDESKALFEVVMSKKPRLVALPTHEACPGQQFMARGTGYWFTYASQGVR